MKRKYVVTSEGSRQVKRHPKGWTKDGRYRNPVQLPRLRRYLRTWTTIEGVTPVTFQHSQWTTRDRATEFDSLEEARY